MRIKAGSLQPRMTIALKENNAPIAGLATATAVAMVGQFGVDPEFIRDTSPTIDDAAGTVTHTWVGPVGLTPGETDVPGRIFWTVEANFGSGLVIFPPYGNEVTDIE